MDDTYKLIRDTGCGLYYATFKEGEDELYTVDEWLQNVRSGVFTDYDGYGYPAIHHKGILYLADPNIKIIPSDLISNVSHDATHIVWFNR